MVMPQVRWKQEKEHVVARYCETPLYVCEVGVGHPNMCHVAKWIGKVRVLLIDANPECIQWIHRRWHSAPLLEVVHGACVAPPHESETIELYVVRNAKRRIATNARIMQNNAPPPPALQDCTDAKPIAVPVLDFADYDDGTIDYLTIDIEGYEWHVVQRLLSRPKVISVEMQIQDYRNPHADEIIEWMQEHGYRLHPEHVDADWLWFRE